MPIIIYPIIPKNNRQLKAIILPILLIFMAGWHSTGQKDDGKQVEENTFTNPLLPSGADPWIFYDNGYYYYTNTLGNRIGIWRTKDITQLKDAEYKTVFTPDTGADSDLLDPGSWTKYPEPVFSHSPENGVYGTGHNCFFKSPDGKEDWFIYHANNKPEQGCGGRRSPRAQKIEWREDGFPNFGVPLSTVTEITKPSGL